VSTLCGSRKYPVPPHGPWMVINNIGNSIAVGGGGRESQKLKILKESMKLNWIFCRGEGGFNY